MSHLRCATTIWDAKCDKSTPFPDMDQISTLLSYWIARSPRFCEQGVFSIEIVESQGGGFQMQASSQVNVDPCKNRFALFFTDIKKRSVCHRCGILVWDQEQGEIEWILLKKFWSDSSILPPLLQLVQDLVQQSKRRSSRSPKESSGSSGSRIYETFFSTQPLLLGSLYFYLRYLQNCEEQRDDLIQELQSQSTDWSSSWSCFVSHQLQESAITSYRRLEQPQEVTFRVTQASQLGLKCDALDNLLHTQCEVKLNDRNYIHYLQRFDDFLVHLVREENPEITNTCYAGYLDLACNVEKKWAQVYSFPHSNRCLGRAMGWIVILIHLEMGPFDLDHVGTPQHIRKQVKQFRQEQLDQPHAMALLVNNDKKEIELFEPNGVTDWSHLVFDALQDYLKTGFPAKEWKWIPTHEYCPRQGIQSISKRAMCGLFSLLWIYLRLHCFEIDREQLNTNLLRGGKNVIDRLIRGLLCKVAQFAHENPLPSNVVYYSN